MKADLERISDMPKIQIPAEMPAEMPAPIKV